VTVPDARRARRAPAAARVVARAALTALAAAGCAGYSPAAPAAVPEGARVRVTLTPAGTAALARTPLGPGVVGLEGAWAGSRGDTVRVRADRLDTSAGVPVAWNEARGTAVALGPGDVQSVARRRTDRGRTALAAGGVVAAGVAFIAVIRSAGRNGGSTGGGGGTPF
jgi:hypothetical protein